MAGKSKLDWEAIERDYRTGQLSDRELAAKYGCSHALIGKRARSEGWQKDLSTQVRNATRAKLTRHAAKEAEAADPSKVEMTVEAAAEANTRVILGHRHDLQRTRNVAMGLLGELEGARLLDEQAELLAEILAGEGAEPGDVMKARQVVSKAVSLTSRIGGIKALAETLTKLQAAERTAFGLDEADPSKGDGEGVRAMTDAERATRLAALLSKARANKEAAGG